MQNAQMIHLVFMALAILLEVAANIFIKLSNGMQRRWLGALGIAAILASFSALSQAVKGIDLSIAYALWGGAGILLASLAAATFLHQRLGRKSWLGLCCIAFGIGILRLS